jgi:hypothetical protein
MRCPSLVFGRGFFILQDEMAQNHGDKGAVLRHSAPSKKFLLSQSLCLRDDYRAASSSPRECVALGVKSALRNRHLDARRYLPQKIPKLPERSPAKRLKRLKTHLQFAQTIYIFNTCRPKRACTKFCVTAAKQPEVPI